VDRLSRTILRKIGAGRKTRTGAGLRGPSGCSGRLFWPVVQIPLFCAPKKLNWSFNTDPSPRKTVFSSNDSACRGRVRGTPLSNFAALSTSYCMKSALLKVACACLCRLCVERWRQAHQASAKCEYLTFYSSYGPHLWRGIDRLDLSDRFRAKDEVRTSCRR